MSQLQILSKNLNADCGGDNSILNSISGELDTIQSQIDGAIAGTALSAVAIVGGVFIICVGTIAGFVTGGASTPVVAGGVALLTAGIAGEVAAAITLKNLNDEKANFLTEKTDLRAEVKLATGISVGYKSLNNQVKGAVTAASGMSNAWYSLSDDLNSMIDDLRNGIKSAREIRTIFLTAANTIIKTVLSDINIIKKHGRRD